MLYFRISQRMTQVKTNSRRGVFCEKSAFRNFAKFRGKHLCWSLFFNKVTGLSLILRLLTGPAGSDIFCKRLRICFSFCSNLWFSDVYWGYRKRLLVWNGLIMLLNIIYLVRIRKTFRKTNISYPLISTCTCSYQGVRNVSFLENCAYVQNQWALESLLTHFIPVFKKENA